MRTRNPKILNGKPIIQGTRISVEFVIVFHTHSRLYITSENHLICFEKR